MTKEEAEEWARSHDDEDDLEDSELDAAFEAIYERPPDEDDREQGLWSLIWAAID